MLKAFQAMALRVFYTQKFKKGLWDSGKGIGFANRSIVTEMAMFLIKLYHFL